MNRSVSRITLLRTTMEVNRSGRSAIARPVTTIRAKRAKIIPPVVALSMTVRNEPDPLAAIPILRDESVISGWGGFMRVMRLAFESQFEPHDDGYVYYPTVWGGGRFVSAAEYDLLRRKNERFTRFVY